jgi:hypothetical protein
MHYESQEDSKDSTNILKQKLRYRLPRLCLCVFICESKVQYYKGSLLRSKHIAWISLKMLCSPVLASFAAA